MSHSIWHSFEKTLPNATTSCERCSKRASMDAQNRLGAALAIPHDLPRWEALYQQTRRGWLSAGVFEVIVHDLGVLLRLSENRVPDPGATILDSRTLQSTPESGSRGGYDAAKRKKGSKVHAAVDTLGDLLALFVTLRPTNRIAYVDEGYTPESNQPKRSGGSHSMSLEVLKSTKRQSVASCSWRELCW